MSVDRYSSLIDPVLTALDAIIAAAQCRADDARAAREFVEFKLYATLHCGDQIRDQLQPATSIASAGVDGVIGLTNRDALRGSLGWLDSETARHIAIC